MENKKPLHTLTAIMIYRKVQDGTMTLEELAAKYQCSYEDFLELAKEKVHRGDWRNILKASERNAKKKRKNDVAHKKEKAKNDANQKLQQKKETAFPKQEKPQAVRLVMPKSPIPKQYVPKRPLEEIQNDLDWVNELLGSAQMVLEDCLNRWKRFCQKTDAAWKAYKSSTQRTSWAKKQAQSAKANCVKNQEVLSYFELLVQNNLEEQELNFRYYAELVGLRQMSQADVFKAEAALRKCQMKKDQLLLELSEATSAD